MKKRMKKRKLRLPMGIVEVLRHKGGPQSSRKGGRGYDRNKIKREVENE